MAAIGVVVIQRKAKAIAPRAMPKVSPAAGLIAPVTIGRDCVRFMIASMSRSYQQLIAFAPPAESVPPISVARISQVPGHPRSATIIGGTVVMSSRTMTRGLVSER